MIEGEPIVSDEVSLSKQNLLLIQLSKDQVATNQEVNDINNAIESNGSDTRTKAPLENETRVLVEAQGDLTNSVNPQPIDTSINSSKDILTQHAAESSQETFDSQIISNINADGVQTISTPSTNPIDSSQGDSNIKTTKEDFADNGISTQDEFVNKNDEAITNLASEFSSSEKSSEDSKKPKCQSFSRYCKSGYAFK